MTRRPTSTRPRCIKLKTAIAIRQRTQREIAIDAQIAETRLSDFICGRAWPTLEEQRRLARVLRFSIAQLFGDEDLIVSVAVRRSA